MELVGFPHLVLLALACSGAISPAMSAGGSWELLQDSVGVSAMHMQLLHNDRVILFDRTNFGASNLTFPPGHPCRNNTRDQALPGGDCTAHSVEYDVASNTFRALSIFTDTWCSSGYVAPDGTLVQTGGWGDGIRKVRLMPACSGSADVASSDWSEKPTDPDVLAAGRWYATNQKLPDGGAIIHVPVPVRPPQPDGNLFVFSNNRAVLFDYKTGAVVRAFPTLGDGAPRNNPNAGSSVLLPLKPNATEGAEVLVCGGAPASSNDAVAKGRGFPPALTTCGRIKITGDDPNPSWVVEEMPSPRVMGDMVLLPNGEVLIVNGATDGVAGWDSANTFNPTPVIYRPDLPVGTNRFEELRPAVGSTTPRQRTYHASAVLLRDGRVLVGGSNPHEFYVFGEGVKFPTELSLEAFSPYYLDASNDERRPSIVDPSPSSPVSVGYGGQLALLFRVPVRDAVVSVTMVAPSFTTHSFAQNQRLLFLEVQVSKPQKLPVVGGGAVLPADDAYAASVTMPGSKVLAPPGYYMVFVVNGRIPSKGIWVHRQ
ncbi:hypothetical protein HU200_032423 [Digitaria exilis]|uniref:Galactose oxidase n=1 Tax=Digitaria exilis TaxID=1010633 RepID=A0A835EPQ7_9POAL|nr:hypothetical protein HU200_032423 [Digitaria exilis]